MTEPLDIARAPSLGDVPHGFFGRRGGVSTGLAAGLNAGLGSADESDAVKANRRRAADALIAGASLVGVYQIHSADCVTVAEPWEDANRPQADALVTDRAGVLLAIVTADCAPVLLVDREAGVIGAAHAGWKGALGGVCENTVAAMQALGARPARISAAIGPCIAQASYEVDDVFRIRFLDADAGNRGFFREGAPGHWQFDLEGYVAARLALAGLAAVDRLGIDTYGDQSRYYSFRRATHRGEPAYGRQISMIGLAPQTT